MANQQKIKLEVATVKLSAIEFEGLRHPETGEYRVAVQQLVVLFPQTVPQQYASQTLKRLLRENLTVTQYHTNRTQGKGNVKPENTIDLNQFRKVIRHLDRKGDPNAQTIMDILIDVSLENLFNDAFGIKNTPENNQNVALNTLQSKFEEIDKNENLNETQKERKKRTLFLEFELEKNRIEEEKEMLQNSDENKKKFIDNLKQIVLEEWDWKNDEVSDEELTKVLKDTIEFYNVFKSLKNSNNRDDFYNTNVFVSKFVDKEFVRGQHTTLGRFAKRICEDYNLPYNIKGSKNNENSEIGLTQNEYPFEILDYLSKNITKKGNNYQSMKNSLKVVIGEIEKLYSDLEESPVTEDDLSFFFE